MHTLIFNLTILYEHSSVTMKQAR